MPFVLLQSGVCLVQVRTGHRTQGCALFTRMGDRFSTWSVSNGLQSIIPTLLTSGCAMGLQVPHFCCIVSLQLLCWSSGPAAAPPARPLLLREIVR